MTDIKEKILTCSCGTHFIRLTKYEYDDHPEIFITFLEPLFYTKQRSKVSAYFRRLWAAIRGKEHLLFEIVLSPEDAAVLRDTLSEMAKENEK